MSKSRAFAMTRSISLASLLSAVRQVNIVRPLHLYLANSSIHRGVLPNLGLTWFICSIRPPSVRMSSNTSDGLPIAQTGFSQQGTLDWVDLVKEPVRFTVGVLSR